VLDSFYITDHNEDEIFCKDVNLLDMVNTIYMEGKLFLTQYRIVFHPYKRIREQVPTKDNPKKCAFKEKFVMMNLSKRRAQYFNIPIHMIYSLKQQIDK